ncbi:MAG: tetratricopeptide repeat protein [Verrucomicrobia bacterium]|nr:tetratricopeptide repeat protein [Verrucomicrobiota bacterium]
MAKRSGKTQEASSEVSPKTATASAGVQGPPTWYRRDWFWGLILILALVLAYAPVWRAGFVWDDGQFLTANPCIVGPLGLKEIWTTRYADICPLVLTTFWVEHALWGLAPLPYHLLNVLLHGACAIVLWRVLRRLRAQGAWLGAALWALHPVGVESVGWITEMKNTESGLFFLLSILFFVRWLGAKELEGRTGGGWDYTLTLLFAALAMAAKSSTVILPVVLCLCAWWMEGRWHWRNVMRGFPIFLMAIAASALPIWSQGWQLATVTDPQWVRTWPQRLAAAGDAVWFYLGKLLWPNRLMAIYPRWQIDAAQWVSYLPLLAVIVIFSIFWLKRALWSRAYFFAFAYFIAALLPVLGLIDNYVFHYSFVFDHFQYLASIGPLALAGAGLARFSDSIIATKPWLQLGVCAGLLLLLGIATWQRTWVFNNEEALWTDAVSKNPNCWAGHYNLGFVFLQKGQVDKAVERFQKALEINPDLKEAHNNLGSALLKKGQVDQAVAQFQKALEIDPRYVEAHNNLGLALFKKGQVDQAVAIGLALFQNGQVDQAVAQFKKASEIDPNSFMTHYRLGVALFREGRPDEAVAEYQRALKINPNFLEAHYNLGLILFKKRQTDGAITQFLEVLRLKPDFSPARDNLAKAQALVREVRSKK